MIKGEKYGWTSTYCFWQRQFLRYSFKFDWASKENENKPKQQGSHATAKPQTLNLLLHFSPHIVVLFPPKTSRSTVCDRQLLHTRERVQEGGMWTRFKHPWPNTHTHQEYTPCNACSDKELHVNTQWMYLVILHVPWMQFHFPLAVSL